MRRPMWWSFYLNKAQLDGVIGVIAAGYLAVAAAAVLRLMVSQKDEKQLRRMLLRIIILGIGAGVTHMVIAPRPPEPKPRTRSFYDYDHSIDADYERLPVRRH
jgi:apolipoprotein N-acyltransferase